MFSLPVLQKQVDWCVQALVSAVLVSSLWYHWTSKPTARPIRWHWPWPWDDLKPINV